MNQCAYTVIPFTKCPSQDVTEPMIIFTPSGFTIGEGRQCASTITPANVAKFDDKCPGKAPWELTSCGSAYSGHGCTGCAGAVSATNGIIYPGGSKTPVCQATDGLSKMLLIAV